MGRGEAARLQPESRASDVSPASGVLTARCHEAGEGGAVRRSRQDTDPERGQGNECARGHQVCPSHRASRLVRERTECGPCTADEDRVSTSGWLAGWGSKPESRSLYACSTDRAC